MIYITPIELANGIREDVQMHISGADTKTITNAENIALGKMKHAWNKRYDISQIFIPCQEFKPGKPYIEGQLMYHRLDEASDYQVFTALQDNSTPPTGDENDLNWEAEDPRDHYVLYLLICLTAYYYFKPEARSVVPQHILDDYEDAKEEIATIGQGNAEAMLPARQVEDKSKSGDFRWGSHPKENHRW